MLIHVFLNGYLEMKGTLSSVFSPWSLFLAKSWVLGSHVVYVTIVCYNIKRFDQKFWQHERRTSFNTSLSIVKYMFTQNDSFISLNEGIVLLCDKSCSFTSSPNWIEILLMMQGWIHLHVKLLLYLKGDILLILAFTSYGYVSISLLYQLFSGNLGWWTDLF